LQHSQDIEDLFVAARKVWIKAHDLVDRCRALTMYGGSQARRYSKVWLDITGKARKIEGYLARMAETLLDIEMSLDKASFRVTTEDAPKKTTHNIFHKE